MVFRIMFLSDGTQRSFKHMEYMERRPYSCVDSCRTQHIREERRGEKEERSDQRREEK
jgi:hypothetical protein